MGPAGHGDRGGPRGPRSGRLTRRVGCVHDELLLRELLATVLRTEGWEVRTFGTCHRAAKALVAAPVDLLVTDLRLRDGDGIELGVRVGAPFVVLSGAPTELDVARALRGGAAGFLPKPFALPSFLRVCRGALAGAPAQRLEV